MEKKQEMENTEELICLDLVNTTHLKTKEKVFHLVSNIILRILTIFLDQVHMILRLILYMNMLLLLVSVEGQKEKKVLTSPDQEITTQM